MSAASVTARDFSPIVRPHSYWELIEENVNQRAWLPAATEIFETPCQPYPAAFFNRLSAIETWPYAAVAG